MPLDSAKCELLVLIWSSYSLKSCRSSYLVCTENCVRVPAHYSNDASRNGSAADAAVLAISGCWSLTTPNNSALQHRAQWCSEKYTCSISTHTVSCIQTCMDRVKCKTSTSMYCNRGAELGPPSWWSIQLEGGCDNICVYINRYNILLQCHARTLNFKPFYSSERSLLPSAALWPCKKSWRSLPSAAPSVITSDLIHSASMQCSCIRSLMRLVSSFKIAFSNCATIGKNPSAPRSVAASVFIFSFLIKWSLISWRVETSHPLKQQWAPCCNTDRGLAVCTRVMHGAIGGPLPESFEIDAGLLTSTHSPT